MVKSYLIIFSFLLFPIRSKVWNKETEKPLRDVYANFFPIGAAVDPIRLKDEKFANFVRTQYSSVTPENHMKPDRIHPQKNVFNWKQADDIVEFATNNKMKVRGHFLVSHNRMPRWVMFDINGKRLSKQMVLGNLQFHIRAMVRRYKGKVYCWDVVNEAVSGKKNEFLRRDNELYRILGPEYIEKAFIYARQADPDVELFYNDFNFEDPVKRDKIYELLKSLKDKGIPVDGVGMQSHLGINGISSETLNKNITLFASLGLKVQITELDVSIYDRNKSAAQLTSVAEDFTEEIKRKQDQVYSDIFRVCRDNKDVVTGITLWGASDGPNYLDRILKKKNYPYLFDDAFRPKSAYFKIINF